jgi:shikimate kinase
LSKNPDRNVPTLLRDTFLRVDTELGMKKGLHSGSTAVVALIITEDRENPLTKTTEKKVFDI